MSNTCYDVTSGEFGNPQEDIGKVINNIISDIKKNQAVRDKGVFGKPGAVIFIPSGDYPLRTQILIDISYLKIMGTGHGFVSSSIRFNTPENELKDFHDIWPGGSRIINELNPIMRDEKSGAAILIEREGRPRISSIELSDFCIDGLHFASEKKNDPEAENSYQNGKTGIYIASAQDSCCITEMGIIYCEHGLVVHNADAITIHSNFIAECGNCIEMRGIGQASKITDNFIGAGYNGHSFFAEHYGGLLIAANNIFPRGKSSIHLVGVTKSSIVSNRLHSFYPGMMVLSGASSENLVSGNFFLRDLEPWEPMKIYDNGCLDEYGLLRIEGSHNTITSNHISESVDEEYLRNQKSRLVIIRIVSGRKNFIAANHLVTTAVIKSEQNVADGDTCFTAQVGALLSQTETEVSDVVDVQIDSASIENIVLDTTVEERATLDRNKNAFRPLPV